METNFWTYVAVLKRRFWVILLLLFATMAVILGRAWTTPPAYQSSTQLQVLPLEPEEVTLYTRLNTVSPSETIDLILFQFENLVRNAGLAQRTLSETNVGMSTAEFLNGVSVTRDVSGDLVTVSATAANPDDAEKLLQKQVDLALQSLRESRARPSEASGKFLQAELLQADKDLAGARSAILQFKLGNHVESLDRELAAQEQAIRDLTARGAWPRSRSSASKPSSPSCPGSLRPPSSPRRAPRPTAPTPHLRGSGCRNWGPKLRTRR